MADSLNGDHSAKMWFKIMWKNTYIQIFVVALILLIVEIIFYEEVVDMFYDAASDGVPQAMMAVIGIIIPITLVITTAYLGFYKFWKKLIK